eukprot:m.314893 g.314893  ORF g.314893 m.314893 type:complete len:70 (-) comp20274_c0_seq14:1497-1706(-)
MIFLSWIFAGGLLVLALIFALAADFAECMFPRPEKDEYTDSGDKEKMISGSASTNYVQNGVYKRHQSTR